MTKINSVKHQSGSNIQTEITLMVSENCIIKAEGLSSGNIKMHHAISVSKGDEFINIISGRASDEIIDMLLDAVNNRTRERNYFQLYCNLLDGSITDQEFDETIAKNEDDYIVDESKTPSLHEASLALKLSRRIKNVDSINDVSSLFSFNPNSLEQLAISQ
jgi:hypothetical protein